MDRAVAAQLARGARVVAVAAVLGVLLVLGWQPLQPPGPRPDHEYVGMRQLAGPGLGGLPLLPVRLDAGGSLVGMPGHLEWYRYCGNAGHPGLEVESEGDALLRYQIHPGLLQVAEKRGTDIWFTDRLGEVAHASDFANLKDGAIVTWGRGSEDQKLQLKFVVLRVDPSWYPEPWRSEFVQDGFIAAAAADTHFCCTVDYRFLTPERTRSYGRDDLVADPCHGDVFDPLSLATYPLWWRDVDYPLN